MDTLNARPQLLRQANLSLIRKVIKEKGTATRAEIARETKISSTTVRTLLAEMMEWGEIESIGYDESSGGRKAERYGFNKERYHSVVFCITDCMVHCLLINVSGEIQKINMLEVSDGAYESEIFRFMDDLLVQKEIRSVGIGVPGIVEGSSFWRKDRQSGEMIRSDIGVRLAQRYQLPVVMENDLNATMIGFGRCYQKEFPWESSGDINMAYLQFEDGCVSAGFLAGGKVIRGCNNFAGELGLIPQEDGRPLDETMSAPMDDIQYTDQIIRILSWICGILNPQYIVLAGPSLREECIGPIGDGLSALLPKQMFADILYSTDVWHDYYDGMVYLTVSKMFDGIQFIKE